MVAVSLKNATPTSLLDLANTANGGREAALYAEVRELRRETQRMREILEGRRQDAWEQSRQAEDSYARRGDEYTRQTVRELREVRKRSDQLVREARRPSHTTARPSGLYERKAG